ncbi:MAG: hypothetical protein HRT68_06085, partial [Flavobacteriaceae bacterium]|nr:hypothetical protein [Flavobacteriaceae bacterium]
MRENFKFIGSLLEEFPNEYILGITDTLSEEYIKSDKKLKSDISSTSQYFSIDRNNKDITLGLSFDVIFPLSNPREYVNTKALLKFVNVNPNVDSEIIPEGY